MTPFQEKTIKFLGKSQNPTSVDVLKTLLNNPEEQIRSAAFDALFLKKDPKVNVVLFKVFANDEESWAETRSITPERLSRLADAAFRENDPATRDRAAEIILKYKLYETLPTIVVYFEGSDAKLVVKAREMLLRLAESFYEDLVAAPSETERRNLDRRREWFVQQLDGPIKRYAVHEHEEVVQALLIITKKDYDTMRTVVGDHRSAACKRISDLLHFGDHGSYVRLLLSYVSDTGSPAVIDEILTTRSDKLFVRKFLEVVGINPSMDFRDTLKRFKGFDWLKPGNPDLPDWVEGLEPNAVQLIQSGGFPKDLMVRLYRFFLERPSFESRRAAAMALRRLVGEDVNKLMLEFVNDPDPETSAILFRILQSRNVEGLEGIFPKLVERPEEEIRQAIYDTMPDLHIESFASRINQMTPISARKNGRFVRLIDPNAVKVITDDIHSPIPIRRQAACKVAAATGLAKDFAKRIIEIAEEDDEINVRTAAIAALAGIMTKEAIEGIKTFLNDRSMDIRDAANVALREWMTAYQESSGT